METHEIEKHMEIVERRLEGAAKAIDSVPVVFRAQVRDVMAPVLLSLQTVAQAVKAVAYEL